MVTEGNPAREPPALELRGLCKSFDRPVVDELNLALRPGEFCALLGPNGAGKTTTLRMIAGLALPDAGSISIFGIDALQAPREAKKLVAWLPDEPMLYDKLDPLEYLEFVAGLWDMPAGEAERDATKLLHTLGLWDHRRERCEGFSRGMKQKVALAGALIHNPRLLLLDEPLTGLDAMMARQVKELLLERARRGATIVLTTHILEVAERLADSIAIIRGGRIVAQGDLTALRALGFAEGASLEEIFLEITKAPECLE